MPSRQDKQGKVQVAVGAVILDSDGRILLVKHAEAKRGGFWFGKWICPGGMLQHGETLSEGTIREVKEETGLNVKLTGKPVVFDRIVKHGLNAGLHVVYVDFLARITSGDLSAGSDVGIAQWFTREELRQEWDHLHEDTQRLLIEQGIVDKDVQIIA